MEVNKYFVAVFFACPLDTEYPWTYLQGAKSGGDEESAQAKNKALADAGAIVPTSFEGLEATVKATYDLLVFTQNPDYSFLLLLRV